MLGAMLEFRMEFQKRIVWLQVFGAKAKNRSNCNYKFCLNLLVCRNVIRCTCRWFIWYLWANHIVELSIWNKTLCGRRLLFHFRYVCLHTKYHLMNTAQKNILHKLEPLAVAFCTLLTFFKFKLIFWLELRILYHLFENTVELQFKFSFHETNTDFPSRSTATVDCDFTTVY